MNLAPSAPSCEPFFLDADPGRRFCVYFPAAGPTCYAGVVHVPAFAEEMNKSRRMVSLQARVLAAQGVGVLLIDLYGCGDSEGDFADAGWDIWKNDVAEAVSWLRRRVNAPVILWGHRVGALLMMDYVKTAGEAYQACLLWQPVVSGEAFLTQFLRLRVANDMISGRQAKAGTKALREGLNRGEHLEVAGYELAPALALPLEKARMADLGAPGVTCYWLEVQPEDDQGISPAGQRVIDRWSALGGQIRAEVVRGEPFWTTQEITECRPLIEATCRAFSEFTP